MRLVSVATALMLFSATGSAEHHESAEAGMDPAMQAAMQAAATPGKPHEKLAAMAGTFSADMTFFGGPDGEPMNANMTVERSLELGGRVMVEHWKGEVMGSPFHGLGRTGFDNVTGRYWSTWTDNWSTGVLILYGHWDDDEDAMVLSGDNVHPMSGQPYSMRSELRFPAAGGEKLMMYEDHGAGEYLAMKAALKRR